MAICYATIKGEVINPREITTANGKKITDFAIKIDTNNFQTKEWTTSFLNGKLIGEFSLEPKTIYEFTGKLDSNVYTKKDGEEVNQIILTAFACEEVNNEKKEPKKEAAPKEDDIEDLPF